MQTIIISLNYAFGKEEEKKIIGTHFSKQGSTQITGKLYICRKNTVSK